MVTCLGEHGSHRLDMSLHGAHSLMAPLAVTSALHFALLQLWVGHLAHAARIYIPYTGQVLRQKHIPMAS